MIAKSLDTVERSVNAVRTVPAVYDDDRKDQLKRYVFRLERKSELLEWRYGCMRVVRVMKTAWRAYGGESESDMTDVHEADKMNLELIPKTRWCIPICGFPRGDGLIVEKRWQQMKSRFSVPKRLKKVQVV